MRSHANNLRHAANIFLDVGGTHSSQSVHQGTCDVPGTTQLKNGVRMKQARIGITLYRSFNHCSVSFLCQKRTFSPSIEGATNCRSTILHNLVRERRCGMATCPVIYMGVVLHMHRKPPNLSPLRPTSLSVDRLPRW